MYGTYLEGIEQLMIAIECNCNVNNNWSKCGYIGSDFKINADRYRYNTNLKLSKNFSHKS
jgi:hypothetical protein